MIGKMIGPGPYRATKLWNEVITVFCGGMPLRRHWVHFRCYDNSFTASEAVDWLHELLKRNHNFGPEVTRSQTIQLLRKFLKNHVIEDIKGRFGREDFDDNGHVYRFPPTSPLKQFPKRPLLVETRFLPKFPHLHNEEETTPKMIPINPVLLKEKSESWNKRHSIAIGELHECKLIQRREITEIDMGKIWKSMTLARLQIVLGLMTLDGVLDTKLINPKYIVHNVYSVNKQGVVVLKDKSDDLPHWVLSAMKCLANWPNSSETMQPIYPGFEKDVLRTVADYFQKLKEPLLTFQLYEVFVNILSLKEQQVAVEALQVCCLLLSPANCRKLQLLLHLMARVCNNPRIPTLNSAIGTRTLMVQTFSCCILSSADEMELDELLATKLVTFMMDKHEEILKGPAHLQGLVEEHIAHLRRVQIKYAGAEDSLGSPSSCRQVKREEFKQQGTSITQGPTVDLLEDILKDKDLSVKEKKNKLQRFQKLYPEIYRRRLPTAESEAAVLREINQRPQLMLLKLRKPFQPFQRSWSFRA